MKTECLMFSADIPCTVVKQANPFYYIALRLIEFRLTERYTTYAMLDSVSLEMFNIKHVIDIGQAMAQHL